MRILLIIYFAFTFQAQAQYRSGETIKVREHLKNWLNTSSSTVECKSIAELPGAMLCLFSRKDDMNAALGRITAYNEGSVGPRKMVVNWEDERVKSLLLEIRGHNIPIHLLQEFRQAAESACASGVVASCLSSAEKTFMVTFSGLLEHSQYLVAGAKDEDRALNVLSHEILHAQYFFDSVYREGVSHFWNQHLNQNERSEFRSFLAQSYDPKDENLMMNEFQAYILMKGAEMDFLGPAVKSYRGPLEQELLRRKVVPIRVQ